jgi:uncharacterized protein YdeI (YjbR/CyaY-like superfamily)
MPRARTKPQLHPRDGRPILPFESRAAFKSWLARNCRNSEGIWLKFAKKGSGVASVTYDQALDVALCFGWIDSLVLSLDARFYLQRFTPRGPRSKWSKINCTKAANLIASGEMTEHGSKQVEAAKADGRWDAAHQRPRRMPVPLDLRRELNRHGRAAAFFAGLSMRHRDAILFQIHDAKKPETRKRRIEKFMAMLKAGQKPF